MSVWVRSETRRWALFAPAALGFGVALFFEASVEPGRVEGVVALALALGACLGALALRRLPALRIGVVAVGLVALGCAAAQLRAWSVAAPVWTQSAEVRLEGRALALEEASDGAPRLLIDRLVIDGAAARETPRRIRVSFRRLAAELEPAAARARLRALLGGRVALNARLFAPPGPAEPGGFDYRRRAWFEGVGALGSALDWPRDAGAASLEGPIDAASAAIDAARRAIAARARAALPEGGGEIAAALLVGDRSGLPPEAVEALRASNLAHLLAISGLHMGIVCVAAFALMRLVFALPAAPPFGLAPKKLAAVAALLVGAAYLLLAGASVPTQRAFIMAAVVFGAILVDRPPVTLRAVALAALVILLLRPESLYEAGFQLSFAATTAMVAVFEALGPWIRGRRGRRVGWRGRLVDGALGLILASLVAGLATAPFAAFAFNRVAPYGLVANLLAVPALGLWIMPMGLVAVALAPLGLDAPFFQLMGLGIDYVLLVAETVASWEGALRPIKAGPVYALGLLALGGLGLCLWRGAALRLVGLSAVLIGLALWRAEPRPDVLIAERGRIVGVLGRDGRAFDRSPVGSFEAELWLRRDGDAAEPAARRRDFLVFDGGALARTAGGFRVETVSGRRVDLGLLCAEPGLVVARRGSVGAPPRRDCVVFDRDRLAETGAVALYAGGGAPRIETAAAAAGRRFWSDRETRRRLLGAPTE